MLAGQASKTVKLPLLRLSFPILTRTHPNDADIPLDMVFSSDKHKLHEMLSSLLVQNEKLKEVHFLAICVANIQ